MKELIPYIIMASLVTGMLISLVKLNQFSAYQDGYYYKCSGEHDDFVTANYIPDKDCVLLPTKW